MEEEQIKFEMDLQKLKDELDAVEVLKELELYFGGLNKKNFLRMSKFRSE